MSFVSQLLKATPKVGVPSPTKSKPPLDAHLSDWAKTFLKAFGTSRYAIAPVLGVKIRLTPKETEAVVSELASKGLVRVDPKNPERLSLSSQGKGVLENLRSQPAYTSEVATSFVSQLLKANPKAGSPSPAESQQTLDAHLSTQEKNFLKAFGISGRAIAPVLGVELRLTPRETGAVVSELERKGLVRVDSKNPEYVSLSRKGRDVLNSLKSQPSV